MPEKSDELNLDELLEDTQRRLNQLQQRASELQTEATQVEAAHHQLLGRYRLIEELRGEVPPLEDPAS